MKTPRSLIALVLILSLFLASLPTVTLASASHQREAQILSNLGLFKGSSNGFELDRKPTRAEGAVMMVRLLGKETQARSLNYSHPFVDVPAWASPYVGYMYKFSLTQGSTPTTYSPNDILSAPAYTTFVLRSLGYSDQKGDFKWTGSLNKALDLGLLSSQEASALASRDFLRDDMVNVSYLTLKAPLKNRDITLIEKLVNEDRAVSSSATQASGLMPETSVFTSRVSFATASSPDSNSQYTVYNSSDMQNALEQAMLNLQPSITIHTADYYGDPSGEFEATMNRAIQNIEQETGLFNLVKEWRYQGNSRVLNVGFVYLYSWPQLVQLNKKCDEIVESLLHDNQSDYDREKLIHDYTINHCRYDYQNYKNDSIPISSRTAYGVIVMGTGVCQGYAEAINILCRKAGLPSLIITGRAFGEDHAWNLIKIAGRYCQLDVTADDPVNENGTDSLSYVYFNLNDKEMQKDHQWDSAHYPACSSMQYNYHILNDQYVNDYAEFADYVGGALASHEDTIELRINNFDSDDYNHLNDLVFKAGTVSLFHYSINKEQGVVRIFGLEYR